MRLLSWMLNARGSPQALNEKVTMGIVTNIISIDYGDLSPPGIGLGRTRSPSRPLRDCNSIGRITLLHLLSTPFVIDLASLIRRN
jgi:hypothetical protein